MSNWYGSARSSYFAVKNPKAFKEFCTCWGVEAIEKKKGKQTLYGFMCSDIEQGGMPQYCVKPDNQLSLVEDLGEREASEDLEFEDFHKELITHLKKGWGVTLIEVGAEKLCYLTGWASTTRWDGKQVYISLEDIMGLANKKLKCKLTPAQY